MYNHYKEHNYYIVTARHPFACRLNCKLEEGREVGREGEGNGVSEGE